MNIPKLRDSVADFLKEKLDGNTVISNLYYPIINLEPDEIGVNVQPRALDVNFADRSKRELLPQLSVTIIKRSGSNRNAACDDVLVTMSAIIRLVHGVTFGKCTCRSLETTEPLIDEDMIANQNVVISQIVLTFLGMEERK